MKSEIRKMGKFPYVWEPAKGTQLPTTWGVYNKGQPLGDDSACEIARQIRKLKMKRAYKQAAKKFKGTSILEKNLAKVASIL